MADKKFYTIITDIGKAKIADAVLSGIPINITRAAVGDGGGYYCTPTAAQTELLNECWRGEIAYCSINSFEPNMIEAKFFVPADVGGFWIREAALIDSEGDMIAVWNTPAVEKTALSDGTSLPVEMLSHIIVEDSSAVNFVINPDRNVVSFEEMESAINTAVSPHISSTKNPHGVTAEQVGADKTGSAQKALSDAKKYTDEQIAGVPIPGAFNRPPNASDEASAGKVWLIPQMIFRNLMPDALAQNAENWMCTAAGAAVDGDSVTITGDGTAAELSAVCALMDAAEAQNVIYATASIAVNNDANSATIELLCGENILASKRLDVPAAGDTLSFSAYVTTETAGDLTLKISSTYNTAAVQSNKSVTVSSITVWNLTADMCTIADNLEFSQEEAEAYIAKRGMFQEMLYELGGCRWMCEGKNAAGYIWRHQPMGRYYYEFTADDWISSTENENEGILSIPAEVHGITNICGVSFQPLMLINGAYRSNVWGAVETWGEMLEDGSAVLHYPSYSTSGGYAGAVIMQI